MFRGNFFLAIPLQKFEVNVRFSHPKLTKVLPNLTKSVTCFDNTWAWQDTSSLEYRWGWILEFLIFSHWSVSSWKKPINFPHEHIFLKVDALINNPFITWPYEHCKCFHDPMRQRRKLIVRISKKGSVDIRGSAPLYFHFHFQEYHHKKCKIILQQFLHPTLSCAQQQVLWHKTSCCFEFELCKNNTH